MNATQSCKQTIEAPRAYQGTQRFEYTLGDVALACDVEYEPACRGSWSGGMQMEPDEPESCNLVHAYVRDVDISELLSDDQVAEIEEAFLCQGVDA